MGFGGYEIFELDPQRDCMPAGQGCGAINELKTCKRIIDEMVERAEALLDAGVVPGRQPAAAS